ncbi:hypothetical protein BT93_B0312 [Corymbia citriodora subsp. variegata]|nr:hypothetical protein BT93_B0312 [Corymbia citriodora subsp. variegata]
MKENPVHPSSSIHVKEGTSEKVHNETGGALSVAPPQSSSRRKNEKIRSTKATRVSVNKKEKILPSTASIAPEHSSRRASNRETRNYKHTKSASNQKSRRISKAEPKLSNCEDKTEKTSDFAVADVGNKMAGTAENSLYRLGEIPKAEKERRSNGTPQLPPSSGKKNLRRSVNACGLTKLPPSSDKKNVRRTGRHVNQSPSSSSLRSTPSPLTSKSSNGDAPSEHEGAEKGNPVAHSNTNRSKRVGTGSSEDKNCQPQILPFRRGKVVEPRLENVPPRKLWFRRPRLLGENQIGKGDAARKSLRRKDIDSVESKSSIKSEKIVLKHRLVEKRENARSLFNNVIEETASKLVETRKSKVKALVGAFETVISLQDTKPKAIVTAC